MPFAKKVISGGSAISKEDIDKINKDIEARFNALTASQQQDAEVIDARDGETSLKARLDRDVNKPLEHYESVEGSYISTDSSVGYAKDVEILGNTIQSVSNLADIRSVGDKVEGQELYEIPVLSVGKNLFYGELESGRYYASSGTPTDAVNYVRGKNFIPVSPLLDLCINFKYKGVQKYSAHISEYDIEYKFIKDTYNANGTYTLGATTRFVRVALYCGNINATVPPSDVTDVQLEYGTVATPYEPYVEDKLTILSPTQLEKVGDVCDRIIEKDGVWGVEKNVASFTLNGTENWGNGNYDTVNHVSYRALMPKPLKYTNQYATSFIGSFDGEKLAWYYIYSDKKDVQGYGYGDNGFFYFRVPNTKTIEDFKQDLNNNPIIVLGCANEPQFIPLPHDQQVKLRTFANKTNISFCCEIEGTIKAQVPKSLGATVNTHTEQVNNLNKELDRVKKLEESTVSTVTTESDFTTVEATSSGYFEDVKLEGKTLVNLADKPLYTPNESGWKTVLGNVELYKTNTTYTFIGDVTLLEDGVSLYISGETLIKGHNIVTFTTTNPTSSPIELYSVGSPGSFVVDNVIILEGDYTQKPLSYFEGLKSVGDGADEIVVSSVNGDGNLFDGTLEVGSISADGKLLEWSPFVRTDYINVKPGVSVFCKVVEYDGITPNIQYSQRLCEYDINKNFIKSTAENKNVVVLSDKTKYIRYSEKIESNDTDRVDLSKVNKLLVCYASSETDYTPYQSDKKPLLYYNEETQTWEKPILREWDSIEKHADGKYYYHVRSGEIVLNGSENWIKEFNFTTPIYSLNQSKCGVKNNGVAICDKYANKVYSETISNHECIYLVNISDEDAIRIQDPSSDVDAFKSKLQANNVTVVYQLAQEKVYECANIDLITYANETNYIVESGAIVPKTTLKVMSNISNVVRTLQEKVSLLENKFIEMFKLVLSGDVQSLAYNLYPEDFNNIEESDNQENTNNIEDTNNQE